MVDLIFKNVSRINWMACRWPHLLLLNIKFALEFNYEQQHPVGMCNKDMFLMMFY